MAKLLESLVLQVIKNHPSMIMCAVNDALDLGVGPSVDFVNQLQKKMSLPQTGQTTAPSADEVVTKLAESIQNASHKSADALYVALTDRCDLPTEDDVRDLINGAWNGA